MEKHQKISETITLVWQNKNFKLLEELLADKFEWKEGPYQDALRSPTDVIKQWRQDLAPQSDIKVHVNVLSINGHLGCYHFQASWADVARGRVEIDGIFLVELSPEGKIASFNQWYAIKPA